MRGTFVHEALERVYARPARRPARSRRSCPPLARACTRRSPSCEGKHRISVDPDRLRAEVRRVEADLIRHLEYAAHSGSVYAARELELDFGSGDEGSLPAARARRR